MVRKQNFFLDEATARKIFRLAKELVKNYERLKKENRILQKRVRENLRKGVRRTNNGYYL